jgi:hypothetical protein
MKNYMKYLAAVLLLLFAPAFLSAQQTTLTMTSLSADVGGNIFGQGGATTPLIPAPVLIQVTSATGIVGLNPNLGITASQPNQSALYVDREMMEVIAVNGTVLTVVRGSHGTVAAPHRNGAMVLVGKPFLFYALDPGGTGNFAGYSSGVNCVTATVLVSPWVNVRSGAQWLCSSITLTWVPGFNNPAAPSQAMVTTAVASVAGATLPSGPLFHVTGTNAITSWTVPVGCNATVTGGCSFTIIPDAVCTWTAAGNIALAGSCVVNKALTFTWDAKNSKWIPSYIA